MISSSTRVCPEVDNSLADLDMSPTDLGELHNDGDVAREVSGVAGPRTNYQLMLLQGCEGRALTGINGWQIRNCDIKRVKH